jgi:adenosylcobinamide-phosphate synthase
MSFSAILLALLLEQARPLGPGNSLHGGMRAWVRMARHNFDAGKHPHAWLAWSVAVVVPTAITLAIHWFLVTSLGWFVAVLWSVAVLYVSLGFRQFSHHFTDIRDALEAGDDAEARRLLADWQQIDARELGTSEIVRQVIEHSVLAAHRHVFGVLAWFSVLAALGLGPAGAVLYRLSEFVPRYWAHQGGAERQPVSPALLDASRRMWNAIDWVPARITALGFAVVGSFEEAIDAWRSYVEGSNGAPSQDGIILAATSGAVNVRLGTQQRPDPSTPDLPGQVGGQEAQLAHLRSIVGLVWRSVVMWMLLLALLSLARLLG